MLARLLPLVLCTVTASAGAQSPVLGIWSFDETSGLTTQDAGPFANHGTLVNFTNDPAQWVPGVRGNALAFDGVDDYVELATNGGLVFYDGLGATFSVAFWVRGAPSDDDRVLSLGSSVSNTPLWTIGTGAASIAKTQHLRLYARNDANLASARYSSQIVFDNTWHHIVYVESSGQARLYVDGVVDPASFDDRFGGRGTRSVDHGTYTLDKVALGAVLRPSICCQAQFAIDDLQVYRFALAAADVATVMAGGSPTTVRASVGEYGVGCGPGPFDLYAAGSTVLGGGGLFFTMRGGRPGGSAFLCIGPGRIAPLDLTALGFPACTLYPANATCVAVGTLDASGSSFGVPFAIPAMPNLAGGRVAFQAIGLGAGGADFSNAIVAVLGS